MTNVATSSPILVTLMKEALSSSETSVLTGATRRNIQEDAILHSYYMFGGYVSKNAVFWNVTLSGSSNRATRRHIPEDGIPHSHRPENLTSYIALISWAL
jgi:hypothetical protein